MITHRTKRQVFSRDLEIRVKSILWADFSGRNESGVREWDGIRSVCGRKIISVLILCIGLFSFICILYFVWIFDFSFVILVMELLFFSRCIIFEVERSCNVGRLKEKTLLQASIFIFTFILALIHLLISLRVHSVNKRIVSKGKKEKRNQYFTFIQARFPKASNLKLN